jgi:hypothetical protein
MLSPMPQPFGSFKGQLGMGAALVLLMLAVAFADDAFA